MAAIAAVLLLVTAPPSPYSALLAVATICSVVIGIAIFLAGLVSLVAKGFGKRYDHTANAIDEHEKKTLALLAGLAERQQAILGRQETILAKIRELDSRAQRICRDQQVLHNKVNRCMGEVSMVNEGLGELREAFVEEGLPERD